MPPPDDHAVNDPDVVTFAGSVAGVETLAADFATAGVLTLADCAAGVETLVDADCITGLLTHADCTTGVLTLADSPAVDGVAGSALTDNLTGVDAIADSD